MPRTRALTDSGKMVQQKVIARNACKALLDEKRISYTQVARILDKRRRPLQSNLVQTQSH